MGSVAKWRTYALSKGGWIAAAKLEVYKSESKGYP